MIDINKYYNIDYNDFIKDWYKFYDWIYWYILYKKEYEKINILYINYRKNRIIDLFIFDKLKDWINIDYYNFYDFKNDNFEKNLKHINKNIEIKENYKLPYWINTKCFKKYIGYEYSIDRLFDIENEKLVNDNYIDIMNFLFDKYFIKNVLEKIN